MSDEEQVVSEEVSEEISEEVSEESQEKATTEFVELDEKVQARFNRVYGNMKQYERIVEQQGSQLKSMIEKLEAMEAAQTETSQKQTIDSLRAAKVEAMEDGDYQRVADIDDQIAELRTPKPQEKKIEEKVEEPTTALTQQDQARLESWATEQDENGQAKRPWAIQGHPQYDKAVAATQMAAADPSLTNLDEILREVDRVMTPNKAQRGSPTVLSSANNGRPKKDKLPELTQDEKVAAEKMGITPEKYAKAKQRWM